MRRPRASRPGVRGERKTGDLLDPGEVADLLEDLLSVISPLVTSLSLLEEIVDDEIASLRPETARPQLRLVPSQDDSR